MNKIKKFSLVFLLLLTLLIIPGCNSVSINLATKYITKDMYVGEKILLDATVNNDEENTIVWSSEDNTIAVVSSEGLVEAIAKGETMISAKCGDLETKALIRVHEKEIERNQTINIIGKQSVLVNGKIDLKAEITPSDFSHEVIWESSDQNIASIDEYGTVTGLKPGMVTIKVSSKVLKSLSKEMSLLVRTGDGIQDIIYNYIYNVNYIPSGSLDITEINKTVVDLVKRVEKSVIGVHNKALVDGKEGVFTGTAGIYKQEKTEKGYKYTAFTNHHVVEDTLELKVYLGDIDEYVPATVVKSDANMDLAVITFEHKNNYTPLEFGEIGSLNKGDFVVAIGNPGGFDYYGSVTFGMVSCPDRLFKDRDMIYVQHDAPINPGNSGGPLFNLEGKVIGINTLKFAAADIEGMGFSIAMEKFLDYLEIKK